MLGQIIRFGGVGGIATLAHVLVALVAERGLDLTAQQANLVGFLIAVLLSYFGHSRFTFQSGRGSSDRFLRFVTVALTGLAASSLTVAMVTQGLGLPFAVAMAAVAVAVPAASFVAMRIWVFADHKTALSLPWGEIGSCTALAFAVPLVFWDRLTNHDIAWYLFATRDWLSGARLYVDLVEVNPPLYFYLTIPGLLLADALGISDANGHTLTVAMLFFTILVWTARILRSDYDLTPVQRVLLLVGVALATTVPTLYGLGQREQVLVLALLPWALREASGRVATRPQMLVASVVAALGICLKPHFVLLPLAQTVLNCLERRSLRPVFSLPNLVFLASGSAYFAFVAMVHPAYLLEVVPMALEVYGAYGMPFHATALRIGYAVVPMAVLLVLVLRHQSTTRPIRVFLSLATGGLLSFLLQGTGFDYHKVPFVTFSAMACFFLLLQAKPDRREVLVAAFALAMFAVGGLQQGFYRNGAVPVTRLVAEEFGPFDGLTTLGSHVYTGAPLALALGTDWASSYPADWLVPGAVNRLARTDCRAEADLCDRLTRIAARNRSDRIDDLVERQPDLLIVDRNSGYFEQADFDWLAFMAEDPTWAAAFAPYHRIHENKRLIFFLRDPESEKAPP